MGRGSGLGEGVDQLPAEGREVVGTTAGDELPVHDELAAVDIVQLLPTDPIPDFVDNMSAFLMVNQRDNQRFVVEIAGYFYLGLRSAASDCLERSSGGLWTFQPV